MKFVFSNKLNVLAALILTIAFIPNIGYSQEIPHFGFQQLPAVGTGYSPSYPDPHKIRTNCGIGLLQKKQTEPRKQWSISYQQVDGELIQLVTGQVMDVVEYFEKLNIEPAFLRLSDSDFTNQCGTHITLQRQWGGRIVSRRSVQLANPVNKLFSAQQYEEFLQTLERENSKLRIVKEKGVEIVPYIKEFIKMDYVNMTDAVRIETYLGLYGNQTQKGVQNFTIQAHNREDYP